MGLLFSSPFLLWGHMDFKAIFLGVSFSIMWSSAFTSARFIVADAPPLYSLVIRFLLAGLLAITIGLLSGQRLSLRNAQWRSITLFGICQNAVYLGLFFVAMQTIEAGLATIIASALPLLVAAFSVAFLGSKLDAIGSLGLALGFGGVIMIMNARLNQGVDPFGIVLCIFGVLGLAIATLSIRSTNSAGNLLIVVGLQSLVGAVVLLPFALVTETIVVNWSSNLVLAFVYTLIMPGIVAVVFWFMLVTRIGTTRAATYHFLNPFFGVAVAGAFLGEPLSVIDIIGVAIIMVGIFVVQRSHAVAAH